MFDPSTYKPRATRFERFLAERGLSLVRLERVNSHRNRIVVSHDGRELAVSFNSHRPTRCALKKLDHHLLEAAA